MLQDLTIEQLYRFDANCRRARIGFRSKYSHNDVLLELRQRHSAFSEMYEEVLHEIRSAPDHLITYLDVWNLFHPGRPWVWRKSNKAVKQILDDIIRYCVLNSLPIITARVVCRNQLRPGDKAAENIYLRCQQLHVPVGSSANLFVAQQMSDTLSMLAKQ